MVGSSATLTAVLVLVVLGTDMGFNYIVIEVKTKRRGAVKHRLPIIYPDVLVHKDVFESLKQSESLRGFNVKVHSAGSCQIHCTDANGKSETLGVFADKDDENLINQFPYWHGIA